METSFRELKYAVGLTSFHSKNENILFKKYGHDYSYTIFVRLLPLISRLKNVQKNIFIKLIILMQFIYADIL
ncbi:hypothetical protein [Faecalimonas sp.]